MAKKKKGHAKAKKFDKDADTPKKQRQWKHIYEGARARGDSKKKAIKKASGRVS